MPAVRRATAVAATLALAGASLGAWLPSHALPPLTWSSTVAVSGVMERSDAAVRLASSAFGKSGMLRAVVTDPNRPLELPLEWVDANPNPTDVAYRWEPLAGTLTRSLLGEGQLTHGLRAPAQAGIWRLRLQAPGFTQEVQDLSVITRVPFSEKRNGYLNGYRIGNYGRRPPAATTATPRPPASSKSPRRTRTWPSASTFACATSSRRTSSACGPSTWRWIFA